MRPHGRGPLGPHGLHGRGPMGRLGCYLRATLRRRLFVWFGVSILLTSLVVGTVMSLMGGLMGSPNWREETERLRTFVGNRFAEVWDEPARRVPALPFLRRDRA